MAFFNKKEDKKPTPLEEIMKAFEGLSDEDKKSFMQSITDRTEESGDVRESDAGSLDEQPAEVDGQEAIEANGAEESGGNVAPQEAGEATEEKDEELEGANATREDASRAEDNRDEIISQLTDRVALLEKALKDFDELKERMEDFTRRQAESFGLKGHAIGGNKDIADMSADELKTAILSGKN